MEKRGGKRPGAGRKKGSSSKIPLEKAVRWAKENEELTPLTVMLQIMKSSFENNDEKMALEAAKWAAPYMHARLSDVKVDASVHHIKHVEEMTDEELDVFIGDADR